MCLIHVAGFGLESYKSKSLYTPNIYCATKSGQAKWRTFLIDLQVYSTRGTPCMGFSTVFTSRNTSDAQFNPPILMDGGLARTHITRGQFC